MLDCEYGQELASGGDATCGHIHQGSRQIHHGGYVRNAHQRTGLPPRGMQARTGVCISARLGGRPSGARLLAGGIGVTGATCVPALPACRPYRRVGATRYRRHRACRRPRPASHCPPVRDGNRTIPLSVPNLAGRVAIVARPSARRGSSVAQSLYEPSFEHHSCGFGFVCDIAGRPSHGIVRDALTVLVNLEHRGASGSSGTPGTARGS